MIQNTNIGLIAAGIFTLCIGVALAYAVELDGPGMAGIAIGAGVGILNMVIALWLTMRALRRDTKAVLRTITGGFLARFLVLVVLIVAFHSTEAVNEVAFALTFMLFFMLFMGLEVRLVEKHLRRSA